MYAKAMENYVHGFKLTSVRFRSQDCCLSSGARLVALGVATDLLS